MAIIDRDDMYAFFADCKEEIRVFERVSADSGINLLKIAMAAVKYIDECPADLDTYPEQWEAWQKYQAALLDAISD